MFKNFAGGMGKGSKINMSALQSMAKQESMCERMRSKIQKKKECGIWTKSGMALKYPY